MLDDLRKRRDDEKTQKKKKQTQAAPVKANQTSLGFAGAQIMGFGSTSVSKDAGYQTAGPRLGGTQASNHMAYNQPSYATDQYQMSNPRT